MLANVTSATLIGVDARTIEVETELSNGLPLFSIIGLPDAAVREAKYRIQAALRSAGLDLPHKKVTVNLAPASVRKDGATLDLPMAMSLLVAAGHVRPESVDGVTIAGELALSGAIRPVRGVLAIASLAKKIGHRAVVVPKENGTEGALVGGIRVIGASDLSEVVKWLNGEREIADPIPPPATAPRMDVDMREVRGQLASRRAVEIAAAGEHNLLLVGCPGGGKTMLARRIPTILPSLELEDLLEVTKIWSAAGLTIGRSVLVDRPFRSPHHTISEVGLIGGGSPIRPGEISLAHHGVLFLDEMPELPRRVLEVLRQPLEDREVFISRARQSVRLPASFMLVGAANPCPCGWLGHPSGRCLCTEEAITRYIARISGALLDRIDMVVETPSLTADELMSEDESEPSATVRARVLAARSLALERSGRTNARLHGRKLRRAAALTGAVKALLANTIERQQLSARSLERTIRVARTIADLAGAGSVEEKHVREALLFRQPGTWAAPTRAAA
jgi:magnesium chelatase family protein